MSKQIDSEGIFLDKVVTKPILHSAEQAPEEVLHELQDFFSKHAIVTLSALEKELRPHGYTLGDEARSGYDLGTKDKPRFVQYLKAYPIDSDKGQIHIGFDTNYGGITEHDAYVRAVVTEYLKNFARPEIEIVGRK